MADTSQSTAPNTAPSATSTTSTGASPVQTAQPANPIGGANIHNSAVPTEHIKVAIAMQLLNGHHVHGQHGSHGHPGTAPIPGDAGRGPQIGLGLPPGVAVNPSLPGSYGQPHLNLQLTGFQPITPTAPSTAQQNVYQPFSGGLASQATQQPATNNSTASGFFSTPTNQTTTAIQAPSQSQPTQIQQPQPASTFFNPTSLPQTQQTAPQTPTAPPPANQPAPPQSQTSPTAQASPSPGLTPQQPSPISPLVAPPSGSLQSGSLAGHIQNLLASMNQSGSIAQIHASLVQTPSGNTTPGASQTVQILPSTPSAATQPAPLIQPSSVTNQQAWASQQTGAREAPGVEPLQRTAPPTRESTTRESTPISGSNQTVPAPEQPPPLLNPRSEPTTRPLPPHTAADLEAALQPVAPSHSIQTQQRIEQLRDIQQIIAAEREPSKPITERIGRDLDPQTSTRQEQTNVALERIRESILDKLTNIQSRIETASTERHRLEDSRGPRDGRIQGRDTLVRPDPIHHDAKPSLVTRLAERLHENQNDARVMRDSITGLASATALERVRVRHIDSTSPLLGSRATSSTQPLGRVHHEQDKLANLIDLLKRFSQRSINFSLLNKMDTSLEKACLTIVTGAAVGYLGLEVLYRASVLVVLHTLASLRDEAQSEQDAIQEDDQEKLEQELAEDLEEFTTTELSTVGEESFVVDLAGIVLAAHSGEPLGQIEVTCSEFGSCHTDSQGRFLFPNIPLGTPYTISVSSNNLNLKPLVITGVCGELEFLTIRVQVV